MLYFLILVVSAVPHVCVVSSTVVPGQQTGVNVVDMSSNRSGCFFFFFVVVASHDAYMVVGAHIRVEKRRFVPRLIQIWLPKPRVRLDYPCPPPNTNSSSSLPLPESLERQMMIHSCGC